MPISREDLNRLYDETRTGEKDSYTQDWKRVATEDLSALQSWVSSIPFDPDCELFEVYEGVLELDPPPESFLVRELRRVLEVANTDPKNRSIYSNIEAYAMIDRDTHRTLATKIMKVFSGELNNRHPQIRRFAAFIVGDWLEPGDLSTITKLRELQAQDPDWRVRHLAHDSLAVLVEEFPDAALEPPASLSLFDRLRPSFTNKRLHFYAA